MFYSPIELSVHEHLHEFPGGFACTICSETFMSETDCVRHTEDVHEVIVIHFIFCSPLFTLSLIIQTFKCIRCEVETSIVTEALYIEHCEMEHCGEGGFSICLECGAGFEEKSYLRYEFSDISVFGGNIKNFFDYSFHIETECGHFRGWTCSQCAAIFQTESALNDHFGSHLQNEIEDEPKCDIIPPLEFASIEFPNSSATDTTNQLMEQLIQQAMDDDNSPSYDPIDVDQNQILDGEQDTNTIDPLIK